MAKSTGQTNEGTVKKAQPKKNNEQADLQPTNTTTQEAKRTRQEWIESAPLLQAERFEVAGALHACADQQVISEEQVRQYVSTFRGGK
ncbi:hypothetical protein O0555_05440 [Brevibacillus laterosporus]|uniref:hypothetical protein n=1 Tax=Brevibacillus laterosporus TaxID=1465 RepID=UPI0018CED2E3|nr:hypothetical protein [Brevibacillus laterosporus]MBG9798237.1 hypothetical protein [Brevibacillus laterosporus]MCR8936793.1 hypothetical protein [Brevibacillus laterosporus]MCZ0839432.1 hypothetical protein [Brevibacillus laterosporus]MCZ0845450.1 hypothetical protein [Brevibacillus laterosporus]MED1912102.1 hypothetical protein [Brevibacillus laterosporus]